MALALVSAAIAVMWLAGCSPQPASPAAEPPRPAYVAEVRAGAGERLSFIGEVRAAQRAELAFAVGGRVAKVLVEAGEGVRAGQVLARLDDAPQAAQAAAAAGDLARAEAGVAEARQRMARMQAAQQAGVASPTEWGAAQAELAAAEAAVRSSAAQHALARWSLDQTVLRAPVDGVVAARHLEAGQTAGPGVPAVSIDGSGRELAVFVPGTLAPRAGQELVLRNGTQSWPSRVLRSASRLEAGGLRKVYLSMPADAAVGSTWSAVFDTGAARAAPPALEVPLRAVLPSAAAGEGQVLRLAADGRTVESAPVKLGALHGEWIEVLQGVAEGQRVVVAGAAVIRPGSVVRPVKAEQEARP